MLHCISNLLLPPSHTSETSGSFFRQTDGFRIVSVDINAPNHIILSHPAAAELRQRGREEKSSRLVVLGSLAGATLPCSIWHFCRSPLIDCVCAGHKTCRVILE